LETQVKLLDGTRLTGTLLVEACGKYPEVMVRHVRDAGRNKLLLLKVMRDDPNGHRSLPRGFGLQQDEFMTIARAALASPENCPDTLRCALSLRFMRRVS
jgi:hypothetical protein